MRLMPRLASVLPVLLVLAVPSLAIAQSAAASSAAPSAVSVVCETLDPLTPAGCDPNEKPPETTECPDGTTVVSPATCPTVQPTATAVPSPAASEPAAEVDPVPIPDEVEYTYTEEAVAVPSAPQIPIPTITPEPVILWDVPTYAEGSERPIDRTPIYALIGSLALLIVLGVALLGRGLVAKIRGIRKPIGQRYGLSEAEATTALAPGDASDFTAFDHMVLSYDRHPEPPAAPPADRP